MDQVWCVLQSPTRIQAVTLKLWLKLRGRKWCSDLFLVSFLCSGCGQLLICERYINNPDTWWDLRSGSYETDTMNGAFNFTDSLENNKLQETDPEAHWNGVLLVSILDWLKMEEEEDRSEPSGSSCLSLKSDWSKEEPLVFSNKTGSSDTT